MSLTVEHYKQLSPSDQKSAMKTIHEKLAVLAKGLDTAFEDNMTRRLPQKILALNQLSQRIPNLFEHAPTITVDERVSEQSANKTRARKRRKLSAKTNAKNKAPPKAPPTSVSSDVDNDGGHGSETQLWRKKVPRTPSEIQRLQTTVVPNESMVAISKLLSQEIVEIMEATTSLKMAISVKVPPMCEGNNFGVEIQDGVIDDLCRAENGALDAADQIASYFQIRSKAISKILKWPRIEDYRVALQEFDESRSVNYKSMAVDLRNSYLILHDSITKNKEKLLKPREERSKFYLY